jgi:hypothetical protein
MMDILGQCIRMLETARFETKPGIIGSPTQLVFENETVVGFVFIYESTTELLGSWQRDSREALRQYQLPLRLAGEKAWNAYAIFLGRSQSEKGQAAALDAVESDLVGTRKIARGGVEDLASLRKALLPLLPLQAAPILEAVDIQSEIRHRTTELPTTAVDGFLSNASESVVVKIFEDLK